MDVKTFIAKIEEFSARYKTWWFPAAEKFQSAYFKEHPKYDYTDYRKACEEFESKLKMQEDVLGEIYEFIDMNYEVYLGATQQECEEIRKAVTNCYYVNNAGKFDRFFENLFFQSTRARAIPELEKTGDQAWLTKGLIAMSIENSGIDYRDSILALSDLRQAAIKHNIDPEPEFARIAQISSNETPRGGSTPMRQLMAKEL